MCIAIRSVARRAPEGCRTSCAKPCASSRPPDLNGDLNKALFRYRNEPLSAFGYKTAERLVSEGRTDDLLRYVASIEAGAAG